MKEKKETPEERVPVQMAIDPITGRDITGEVISRRLKELEVVANEIIKIALEKIKKEPEKKKEIYEEAYWEIHQELGMGSIGPATAAAGPLMYKKMDELAEQLEIAENDKIF